VLRATFARWGLPRRLRVDNGVPWGSPGDLPTDLVLWLAGLGVPVRTNPPGRPQDNGVVERAQGVGKRWAEPQAAESAERLQATLEELDRIQREAYPHRHGRSRLETYPSLDHSGRSYRPEVEAACWRVEWAHELLAGFVAERQVDRSGQVSIYNRNYYIGKLYAGGRAYVRFDPQQRKWLLYDESNRLVNQHDAPELEGERIRALNVTHRRRGWGKGLGQLAVGIEPGQLDVG
jgi:hypothetical protein